MYKDDVLQMRQKQVVDFENVFGIFEHYARYHQGNWANFQRLSNPYEHSKTFEGNMTTLKQLKEEAMTTGASTVGGVGGAMTGEPPASNGKPTKPKTLSFAELYRKKKEENHK